MINHKKHIIVLIALLSLALPLGISLPASAAMEDACGKYTADAKEACEKGYQGQAQCATYTSPAQKAACNAGRTQATTDGNQNGNPQNPQNPGGGTTTPAGAGECGGAKTGIIDCKEKAGVAAIGGLIKIAVNVLTVLIGIIAVGGIGYAAILYASARDDQSQVQNAIGIIRNIVIGLVLYGFTIAIINWLTLGGVVG